MAVTASIEWVNLDQLRGDLATLPRDLTAAARVLVEAHTTRAAAAVVAGYARGPTGNLKGGVWSAVEAVGAYGVRGRVVQKAPHVYWYERGTKERKTRNRGKVQRKIASRGAAPKGGKARRVVFVPTMQAARAVLDAAVTDLLPLYRADGVGIMSDGAAVDVALVDYLRADPALAALCPDGVYLDESPAGSARFVLVTHNATPVDEGVFGGRGFTVATYRVVVVGLTPAADGAAVRDAVARIDVLLEGAAVPVAGLAAPATVARVGRIRTVVIDDDDRSERWFLRGGLYEVFSSY